MGRYFNNREQGRDGGYLRCDTYSHILGGLFVCESWSVLAVDLGRSDDRAFVAIIILFVRHSSQD
jgi:hypothetical protein